MNRTLEKKQRVAKWRDAIGDPDNVSLAGAKDALRSPELPVHAQCWNLAALNFDIAIRAVKKPGFVRRPLQTIRKTAASIVL